MRAGVTTMGGSGCGVAQAVKSSAHAVSVSASCQGLLVGGMDGFLLQLSGARFFRALGGLGLACGAQGDGQGFGVDALALGQVGLGATVAPGVAGPGAGQDEQQHAKQEADHVGEQARVGGHG